MFTICLGARGAAVASRYLNKKADGEAAALVATGDAANTLTTDKEPNVQK
jgi:hypothetical protein